MVVPTRPMREIVLRANIFHLRLSEKSWRPNEERVMRTIKELKTMTQKLLGTQWGDKRCLYQVWLTTWVWFPNPCDVRKTTILQDTLSLSLTHTHTRCNLEGNDCSFAPSKTPRWMVSSGSPPLSKCFHFLSFLLAEIINSLKPVISSPS